MNFIQILIANGFVPKEDLDPEKMWYGLSLYHPDNYFIKGNKKVEISLHGTQVPPFINDENAALWESKSIKWISLKIGDKYLYHSWSGIVPDEGSFENFLNR